MGATWGARGRRPSGALAVAAVCVALAGCAALGSADGDATSSENAASVGSAASDASAAPAGSGPLSSAPSSPPGPTPAGEPSAATATVPPSDAPPAPTRPASAPAHDAPPPADVSLLEATPPRSAPGLPGWSTVGDALWEADGRTVHGRVGGGAQSFLVSDGSFGDFALDVDVRNLAPGNSGIQIRSHVLNGRLRGYQVEIDPSDRAWSGGIYDEGRRGWLDNLAEDAAARAAFQLGEWNHFRVVCEGPWLRAWVNDVPTADLVDPVDGWGHLALQVHSGNNTDVQWRDLTLVDHGVRPWERLHLPDDEGHGVLLPYAANDRWLRLEEDVVDGAWRAVLRGRGPLLIALRSAGTERPLAIPAGEQPALWAERHGVFGRIMLSMEPQTVALAVAGGRAVLLLNDAPVASLALPDEVPARGAVALAGTADALLVAAWRQGEPVLRDPAPAAPRR